jgi:pyrroloquinoline quinone biosynthesis protein D
MTAESIPRRHERYAVEWMDNESLIYRSPSKMVIYLNETATVIWRLCDGTRTVKQIVDLLVNAFPEAASDVRVDVKETIDELVRNGALTLRPRQGVIALQASASSVSILSNTRSASSRPKNPRKCSKIGSVCHPTSRKPIK